MDYNYADRLARAAKEAGRAGLDGLVVTPSADLVYLAGYDPPPLERLTALILRNGRPPVMLVPELERPRAVDSPAGKLMEFATWQDGDDPYQAVRALLPSKGTFGATDTMWARHLLGLQRAVSEATFVPASRALSELRARKDPGEIQLLSRAARGADQTFRKICLEGIGGRPEEDVARSLARHLVEAGHESAAFTIVGSGPNGASPHHDSGSRGIRSGDPVVLDFGGRVDGYCSDMTRTVSVGEPSGEVKEIHAIVMEAQEAAFQVAGAGVPAEEVDSAARQVIEDAGYGYAFFHRTGHGIGLDEHEPPYIVEGNLRPLEVGNCFSIEPGIYLEGRFGVRIEDIVAITPEGATRLNHAPRELTVVP